jgi:hypothetical protein
MTGAEMRESPTRQSLGREAGSGMATGREDATGKATGRAEGGVTHEDSWDQQGRVATGDVTGDGSPDARLNALPPGEPTTSTIHGATGDDDGGPADAAIIKSKSNITNN